MTHSERHPRTGTTTQLPFGLERLGVVMRLDPDNDDEAWGVLNPAGVRSHLDGEYYLYPRVVAEGNYSRIGLARVEFDGEGTPVGVERLGYALEPERSWEKNATTAGVEDARVVFVEELSLYVMTYTAYSSRGPRIGFAISDDARTWERVGLARFAPEMGAEWDHYDNKDALVFPTAVPGPDGSPRLAMIHRADFHILESSGQIHVALPHGVDEPRPSMWISYTSLEAARNDPGNLCTWSQHRLLATPQHDWEHLKIGGGTPPVMTELGWVTFFHGVSGRIEPGVALQRNVHYRAGAMVLDPADPGQVLYRSPEPILSPESDLEQHGTVDNVVFPTAVDRRDARTIDVYYGMADAAIGVARCSVPAVLPG